MLTEVLLGRWNNFIGFFLLCQICHHKVYMGLHCCTIIWDWNNFTFLCEGNQEPQSWPVLVWGKISGTDSESKCLNPSNWTHKWDGKTLLGMCGKQMGMLICCWPHSSSTCADSPCSWAPLQSHIKGIVCLWYSQLSPSSISMRFRQLLHAQLMW